jgi:hypothetical protein
MTIPNVVPSPVSRKVFFIEKAVLHGRFVDCDCRGEEPETEDDGEADARLEIDLEAPDHGDGDKGEKEVGCDVDGGVEDADVFEGYGVEAFGCAEDTVSRYECAW